MKTALIITNGNAPASLPPGLPEGGEFIVAVDKGLELCIVLGVEADIAVGDFDSLTSLSLLKGIETRCFPADKDCSDTELGIRQAYESGCDSYVLLGGGEGRMDHLAAIWSLFPTYGAPQCWLTRQEASYKVDGKRTFLCSKDETVSVLPCDPSVICHVTAEQLRWPLHDFTVGKGALSLSNRCTAGKLEVSSDGPVFITFLKPRENHW
ncbi:MAG: thiamine diphosphokinase [Spirochaetia bacterium]|jgi:thiamine pyrophosphokinase|nr:thiamine diphosphokinase [Spirochaetia bacterium]